MSTMTISIKRNSNNAGYPVQDRFALNFDTTVIGSQEDVRPDI